MFCNLTVTEEPKFALMLTLNSVGVFVTAISLVCVIPNTSIDQSLRSILLSFTVANVLGTCMLIYDSFVLLCFGNHLNFTVTITMTLSVTHLLLLVLTEYISLTAGKKQRARDHTGLLLISWIISITFGSMNVVTIGYTAKMAFVVIYILSLLAVLRFFIFVLRIHKLKKKMLVKYKKTFLWRPKSTRIVVKKWKIKLLAIIVYSYIVCSLPWILNEIHEGIAHHSGNHSSLMLVNGSYVMRKNDISYFHTLGLIVYSLHFYFPSSICIFIRHNKRNVKSGWKIRSYRYRDTNI